VAPATPLAARAHLRLRSPTCGQGREGGAGARVQMAAPDRAVVILGDEISLGQGVPDGKGFVTRIEQALAPYGVDVIGGWSREGETAVGLATEPEKQEELKMRIRDLGGVQQLIVVIALGMHDRIILGDMMDMLEQALQMIIRLVQNMNAIPILMQIVPDDIDGRVGQDCGAAFCPVPVCLAQQYQEEGGSGPFLPNMQAHEELANNLLAVLAEEMRLPLRPPEAPQPGGPFDGIWVHKDHPGMLENIQDGIIRSDDGSYAQIHLTSKHKFYIEHSGQKVHAEVRGNELIWSDGDVWTRLEDDAVPLMSSPPAKKNKGDLKSFLKVWEKAEEANKRSRKETTKNEIRAEQDRLNQDREMLDNERQRLEEGMKRLHEETEQVSAMREEIRESEEKSGRGLFGCWQAG